MDETPFGMLRSCQSEFQLKYKLICVNKGHTNIGSVVTYIHTWLNHIVQVLADVSTYEILELHNEITQAGVLLLWNIRTT